MKQIVLDKNKCFNCGACYMIDQEHFAPDNSTSTVISNDNLENDNLISAINACPASAISIVETDEKECKCKKDCECDPNNSHCECNCGCDCHNN